MRRGDMAQLNEYERADRQMRQTVALGGAMILLLLMATGIGVFLGFLIWGI